MSRTRYRIWDVTHPHFLTCAVVDWLPVFSRPEAAGIVLDSWRFFLTAGRMTIYGYVDMENHLHFVASAADLVKEVKEFESFTARKIIDFLHNRGEACLLGSLARLKLRHRDHSDYQLWQEGSHPQQIAGEEMMLQKLEYIHDNPVRRGYVERPEHWRYSSARDCLGQPGLVPVTTDWR